MLSASSSNNHSLFSFGRSNGTSASTASSNKHPQALHLPSPLPHQLTHLEDDLHDTYFDGEDGVNGNATSYDFLPSVSFDDLQSSLESASTDFQVAHYSTPMGQGSILDAQDLVDKMVEQSTNNSYGGSNGASSSTGSASNRPAASAAVLAAATATGAISSTSTTGNTTTTTTRITIPQSASASTVASNARVTKTGPILRRPSISTRQSIGLSSSNSSSPAAAATSVPASSRQRRQSHYPPVSNSNIVKPPRKSIGSGVIDSDHTVGVGRSGSRRRTSLASNSDGPISGSTRSSIDGVDGGSRLSSSGSEAAKNLKCTRDSRTHSLHKSSRSSLSTSLDPIKPSGSSIQRPPRTISHSNSVGNFSSTANTSLNGVGKSAASGQSMASKRMSMAPVLHATHATGLGARTVSPTDARRMKRMSTMPPSAVSSNTASAANSINDSHDIPQTSNVPLPSSIDIRASSRSPSMLPRKAPTPSSSRTTPDPNRKSLGSGLSVGSSVSFNTVRSSNSSLQPRLPQGSAGGSGIAGTGSRLPAPKPPPMLNSVPSMTMDDGEDVPPVPAIPKVYDSPKGTPAELSFLEKRKSNLVYDGSSIHSSSTTSISGSQLSVLEAPAKIKRKQSSRAVKDHDKASHTVTGQPSTVGTKKSLQPLRLPPINLMPLSGPTAAKVAALQEQHAATPDRSLSPPPSRIIAKTPTTPMTASKGSFFSRMRNEERAELTLAMRSSSSIHQHTRTESTTDNGGDETSSLECFPASSLPTKDASMHQQSASPYLPASAHKGLTKDSAHSNSRKTSTDDSDSSYTTPSSFITPIPPPIPASTVSTMRKPSGPRAPAPTPSRAFAPFETASTIVPTGDPSFVTDPMPKSTSVAGQAPKSPPPMSSSDEPTTPSSIGSSLRRKLSLSWKRGNTKSSLGNQGGSISDKPADPIPTDRKQKTDHSQEKPPFAHHRHISSVDKHEGMPPPPRIPKSATMSNIVVTKKSPTAAIAGATSTSTKPSGTYLESRRRKSSASSLSAILSHDKTKPEPWTSGERYHIKGTSAAATASEVGTSSSSSHAAHSHTSVLQKILKTKQSAPSVRQQHDMWTVDLDSDDLIAEEEMRKLGSRRKDTELAARTLDALRKRATPKERVSPQEAARIAVLNIYERGEIVDYNDIYFCGTQNAAKVVGDVNSDKLYNFGYDDERGDYAIVPGDHLAYRYEIIDLLGKGSFGQVVRCIDHKTGVLVAVKIIRNKKRFHQQALVEVNILQKLREWVSLFYSILFYLKF